MVGFDCEHKGWMCHYNVNQLHIRNSQVSLDIIAEPEDRYIEELLALTIKSLYAAEGFEHNSSTAIWRASSLSPD